MLIEQFLLKPVATILGIPTANIFANQLLFGSSGEFLGFDKDEPTSRSGGKAKAVQQIRKVSLITDRFYCLLPSMLLVNLIKLLL